MMNKNTPWPRCKEVEILTRLAEISVELRKLREGVGDSYDLSDDGKLLLISDISAGVLCGIAHTK